MIHSFRKSLALSAALAALALPHVGTPAKAQNLRPSDIVSAELRTGWRTDSGTHMAALHLRLAEGWKTYWRSPGDAGIPPTFDWSGSHNVASVRMHWPRPEVFNQNGYRSIGYDGVLVLPLEFTPRDADQPLALSADVLLGVCQDICVPVNLNLNARLPFAGASDALIEAALRDRPEPAARAGLRDAQCGLTPITSGLQLVAELDLPQIGQGEFVVFELPDRGIWISEARTSREGDRLTATADFISFSDTPVAFDRSDLRITILAEGRAVETRGCTAR